MHRGSSNDARGRTPAPESLPLSASPALVSVVLEFVRAASTRTVPLSVPRGTPLREALKRAGAAPEGCAAFVNDRACPLDTPLDHDLVVAVLPTFSGG